MLDFLDLPERSVKPRPCGITHVIDRGMGLNALEDILDTCSEFIDIVKLGWGTGYVTRTHTLKAKIDAYKTAGIPVCFGGTLTEVVLVQGKLEAYRDVLFELGITHVEVSSGVVDLSIKAKAVIIRQLALNFVVLSEVGSKDVDAVVAPYRWANEIESDLEAGAWKVIMEARESGTVGLYRSTGEVRMGLVEEIVSRVPPTSLIFEAPQKAQQVWFIEQFGSNVNLGNIASDDVIPLETLRLGLRGDTLGMFHLKG